MTLLPMQLVSTPFPKEAEMRFSKNRAAEFSMTSWRKDGYPEAKLPIKLGLRNAEFFTA